ncbi:MAG TPA: cyclopropane-fatty-acyl-phospholipid synthase family protein [Rhizomicrobium sp.]|nr:cyclopropane-fatty-acyl-phospholipid synthase family protein [Rhizomicrobium sp.]
MSFATAAVRLAERHALPDLVIRAGMRRVIAANDRQQTPPGTEAEFARGMEACAIAEHADAANRQHYELPPEFFALFLGPRRKYSSCLYATGRESLAEAEIMALAETAAHAGVKDGEEILELGCGWGSLSLYMAETFPATRITCVSNSAPQRLYIEAQARARGLANLNPITADMNDFAPQDSFDRIVSVEMFEHMANWRALLTRTKAWLKPHGRLFLHIFAHRHRPARYDWRDPEDWMGRHFFTGGLMPTAGLIRQFGDLFAVEEEWRWSGSHYRQTALQWLELFDANRAGIDPILRHVYGGDAPVWRRRWRMFFLATAESFGFNNGESWGVNHYRLRPALA